MIALFLVLVTLVIHVITYVFSWTDILLDGAIALIIFYLYVLIKTSLVGKAYKLFFNIVRTIEVIFVMILSIDLFALYVSGQHFNMSLFILIFQIDSLTTVDPIYFIYLFLTIVIMIGITYGSSKYIPRFQKKHIILGLFLTLCLLASVTIYQQYFITSQRASLLVDNTMIGSGDVVTGDNQYLIEVTGQGMTGNVILLFAESFSRVDSTLLGGMKDKLPGFDYIAKDGIYFTNFISNGCTSDTSHVATLYGSWPWSDTVTTGGYYDTFTSPFMGLGHFFNALDYDTFFVSTAPLDFQDQRSFIKNAGFSTIFDEYTFSGNATYTFGSAPDHVLYDKILTIDATQQQPYFLAAQTISTHLPYDAPYGKIEDEVREYANDSLKEFYDGLVQQNYFDDGILIIVSDHRKFDLLTAEEREQRGQSAYGRIVATIVGAGIKPGVSDNLLQHIDIYHFLTQRYGEGLIKTSRIANDPLAPSHQQGRDRTIRYCVFIDNQLHVVTYDDQYYVVDRLDTDAANFAKRELYQQGKGFATVTTGSYEEVGLVGHRGGSVAGQNTMKGIRSVAANGVKSIEIDVASTKDGVILLTNGHMNNTSCKGMGVLSEYDADFVLTNCVNLDNEPLHMVQDALGKMAGLFDLIFLELKIDDNNLVKPTVEKVVEVIHQTGLEKKVVIISYNEQARLYATTFADIQVGRDSYTSDDAYAMDGTVYPYFLTEKSSYTSDQVAHVHSLGKKFVVYTLDTIEELQQAIDAGVDLVLVSDIVAAQQWLGSKKNSKNSVQ